MTGAPAAERGSNFFLGFLFLSSAKREALSAVYAYCRQIDDIVDSGHLTKEEAAKMLDFWTAEVERLFAGRPTHSIAARLRPCIAEFGLPKEPFHEMIRGCRMDLEAVRYETLADLESYMRGVACSVGDLSVRIFGTRHTPEDQLREFVTNFGYAFQLTNIIRDVGADLELGRVYLPDSEMKAAGYSREALVRREHSPALDRVLESLYKRAKGCYQRGRNMVDFRDRPGLLPAEIMAHVYEGILDEIKAGEFRVLFHRATISPWRKLRLASKAWLYCHGIH